MKRGNTFYDEQGEWKKSRAKSTFHNLQNNSANKENQIMNISEFNTESEIEEVENSHEVEAEKEIEIQEEKGLECEQQRENNLDSRQKSSQLSIFQNNLQGNNSFSEGKIDEHKIEMHSKMFDEETFVQVVMTRVEKHQERINGFQRKIFELCETTLGQIEEERQEIEEASFQLYSQKMQEITASNERIGKLEETLGTFLGSIENVFTSTFTGSED